MQSQQTTGGVSDDPPEADLIRQAVAGDRVCLSRLLLLHYDDLVRHISRHMSAELHGVVLVDDTAINAFAKDERPWRRRALSVMGVCVHRCGSRWTT